MAISKLDFARGRVVNPLDSIGDDLLKFGSSLHQQDKDRLAAERQNEMLNMQKQEHQMRIDAVAQAAKEKKAANAYADALGAATSGNVIGLADQKLLGDKVGALGDQAAAAYAGGDNVLGDKLVTEQESYINSVLPKMTKAYEASPEAQLQVLRGTNPLGGTADLAPQTRLALLKEAEAPIEKMQATNAAYAAKLEEAKIRAAERAHDKSLAAQQAMILAKVNADNKMEIAKMQQAGKTNKDPNDAMTILATVNGEEILMSPNKIEEERKKGAKITAMRKVGTDPDGESGGGSGGSGGGSKASTKYENGVLSIGGVRIPDQDATLFGMHIAGRGDTRTTARTVENLLGLGYKAKNVQEALDKQSLDIDNKLSVDNVDNVLPPMQLEDGTVLPASTALSIQEKLGKDLIVDSKGKLAFSGAKRSLTKDDLKELGFAERGGVVLPPEGTDGVLGAPGATTAPTMLPKPTQPSIYGQGQDLAVKVKTEQDKLVKSYDPTLPNKQWLSNTKAEIYDLRQKLGGDEFERRYPGVAAGLKLY